MDNSWFIHGNSCSYYTDVHYFFALSLIFFGWIALYVMEKHYFCKVQTHAVPSAGLCHRGWWREALYNNVEGGLRVVGWHYLMLKRHRCFAYWLIGTWEISREKSMTMSEVAATGMEQLYPGVCSEGLYYIPSCALSPEICADTGVGRHSTRQFLGLSQGLNQQASGGGSPRFAFV